MNAAGGEPAAFDGDPDTGVYASENGPAYVVGGHAWPAASVELWPIGDLIPYARNARTHSDAQVAQLAASIRQFGFTVPILCDEGRTIIAGHGRVLAARKLGLESVPVMTAQGWTDAQKRAYIIADNKLALNADWDLQLLGAELQDLDTGELDLGLTGFAPGELEKLLTFTPEPQPDKLDETANAIPEEGSAVTCAGDVWILGTHRLMCGDSTNAEHVAELIGCGPLSPLLHADPPYGMDKHKEGIVNDNLHGAKLDAFQMAWWSVWRKYLAANASAYVWGAAEDLWRLWFTHLANTEPLQVANEIVWDKKAAGFGGVSHMGADSMSVYPHATERCLFLKIGRHGIANAVKDEYWPGWDPLRLGLVAECDRMGWSTAKVNQLCNNHMAGHWFGTSQWCLIAEHHYETLRREARGEAFTRPYSELRAEYERLTEVFRAERPLNYFDNTHDTMRDVWEFPRVTGEERHGHATPKPVEMIARALKSSSPSGSLVLEPFAGSGSTMIAAEATGRVCYSMEISARYVDVCVRRWQEYTGQKARLAHTGETFEGVERESRAET